MKIAALIPEIPHRRTKRDKHVKRSMSYFGLQIVIKEIETKWNITVDWTDIHDSKQYDHFENRN